MKNILYLAMSLNGMIATKDDDAPWSDIVWKNYSEAVDSFKNIIIGRRTYELMKEGGDFDSFKQRPYTVVLSSSEIDDKDITVVSSPMEALKQLSFQGCEVALIGGGQKTATAFLKENYIDEIILDIEPMIMGEGIALFEQININRKLALMDKSVLEGGVLHLEYEVRS